MSIKIIGAGLAGLLAAHSWPRAELIEANPVPLAAHKALLRFRTEDVSHLTGIPFKRVTVRKGIWSGGRFVQPDIQLANRYAKKVTYQWSGDRSIWNLNPVERFIAPETFYDELLETVGKRIAWGQKWVYASCNSLTDPLISTAPLPLVIGGLKAALDVRYQNSIRSPAQWIGEGVKFNRAPITVTRYRLAKTDLYQTIYFPDEDTSIYRASITGSLLICESVGVEHATQLERVLKPFGMDFERDVEEKLDSTRQEFGKIVPLEAGLRKNIMFRLTQEHNIFSLGRFATWRNCLLDDVVQDIDVLRRLIRSSGYDRSKILS